MNAQIALGWQRPEKPGEPGRWHARKSLGVGRYAVKLLGEADDLPGRGVSFSEATALAAIAFDEVERELGAAPSSSITIEQACRDYVRSNDQDETNKAKTLSVFALHVFRPEGARTMHLGDYEVRDVTKKMFEDWRADLRARLAQSKRDRIKAGSHKTESVEEVQRKAKETSNRIMKMLKTALNRAAADAANAIATDKPWKGGLKNYRGTEASRTLHYTEEEIGRFLAKCPSRDLAVIANGAWLIGCRPGEARKVRVGGLRGASLHVPKLKTKARNVPLLPETRAYFEKVCAGRRPEEYIFTDDGRHWTDDRLQKEVRLAVAAAGWDKDASFYTLRHSHISRAIEANVPLSIIAENCGTSVVMIEKNYKHILDQAKLETMARFAPRVHVDVSERAEAV